MGKKGHLLFILIFFIFNSVKAQSFDWKKRLVELENLKGESFQLGMVQYYDSISKLNSYQEIMEAAHAAFIISSEIDEIAHVQSLLFKATRSIPPQTDLFHKAYALAARNNDVDEICKVEYERGRFFVARKQFDSAVIHILRYKDLTEADIRCDGYQNILEILGDVYYHAGLYDQATDLYLQIYTHYEAIDNWNYYRPYVMMNNLGQVALKLGDTQRAKAWFVESLEKAELNLHQYYRFNSLAYIRVKLAETALKENDLGEAQYQLDVVRSYPQSQIQNDVHQEFRYYLSILLLKQDKFDEAESLAKSLLPCDTLPNIGFRFVPEIYWLMAEIADKQSQDSMATYYYQVFYHTEDSLKEQENIARSMIILAEREHEITKTELTESKKHNLYLALVSLVVFSVLIIIIVLNRRLYKSKIELMGKSINRNPIGEQIMGSKNAINTEKNKENFEEQFQQKKLIEELKQLMKEEKPYLDPSISIQKVAQMLSTNRTYLSKAINSQLNTSFPNLLKEYRIQEAIDLISEGYAKDHTQEALAKKVGFASRNVFTNAFKKQVGVLPSFFIANIKRMNK